MWKLLILYTERTLAPTVNVASIFWHQKLSFYFIKPLLFGLELPASGWFFCLSYSQSSVIHGLKNRHFHHLKKKSQRLNDFTQWEAEGWHTASPPKNPGTTCTVQCAVLEREALVSYSLRRIHLRWVCCIHLQLLCMNEHCISKWMLGQAPAFTFWPPTVPMCLWEAAGAHSGSEKE